MRALQITCLIILTCFSAPPAQAVHIICRFPSAPYIVAKDIDGVTLREAIAILRDAEQRNNSDPWDRPNVIVEWAELVEVQKTCKIWVKSEGMPFEDTLHAIATTLGLGYTVEEYAVKVSSRQNLDLPKRDSRDCARILETIRTSPKILVRLEPG